MDGVTLFAIIFTALVISVTISGAFAMRAVSGAKSAERLVERAGEAVKKAEEAAHAVRMEAIETRHVNEGVRRHVGNVLKNWAGRCDRLEGLTELLMRAGEEARPKLDESEIFRLIDEANEARKAAWEAAGNAARAEARLLRFIRRAEAERVGDPTGD